MSEQELSDYITQYRSTVFRVAFNYVKNPQDAEDISQDAFVRLYLSAERFESGENVKAWLIRVTINLCKNLIKSSRYKERSELKTDIPVTDNSSDTELYDCIRRLSSDYSAVIYLFYYEGYSVKEIAKIMRISSSAVRTRLSRGRNRLKEMLQKEDEI